ncbi:MAG: sodium-dependent transporter [Rhodothermales bacterium]
MSGHSEQRFSSRWGLLLSVLGIAVGTGNIWRFPRIAAQNSSDDGAGAFLIAWAIFLLMWSVPLIIAEYALGRKGRMGLVGTFTKIVGERFAWMGAFIAFVATAIMFYYSVVAGWCLFYFTEMLTNPLPLTTEASTAVWEGFQTSGTPIIFHAIAMGFGALVVWRGISSIERVNKILIPTLVAIVLIALFRSVTLDGATEGIKFLFTPDWSLFAKPQLWLDALTQNAWDTGAGWGLILTYGAYMQREHGIVKNSFITGVGNNTVSLVAAVTIFAAAFAILGADMSRSEVLSVMKDSGPAATGLTFIWMPQIFAAMPAGNVFAILFFLGLSFAAFSSLISMIELSTRIFVDGGLSRTKAVMSVCSVGFLLGVPSAMNLDILGNQDYVWGVALMISGAMVAFAVIKYGPGHLRREEVNATPGDWGVGKGWGIIIRYAIPLQAIILLGWWLYVVATTPGSSWYDPTEMNSLMNFAVQWGAALIFFMLINRWLVARLKKGATVIQH